MHEHDVTQVDIGLPPREGLLAHPVEADHHLELRAVAVLQGGKAELSLVSDENDTAGDPGFHPGLRARFEVSILRTDLSQRVGARHRNRVRVTPL